MRCCTDWLASVVAYVPSPLLLQAGTKLPPIGLTNFVCLTAGLFPDGRPKFQSSEQLKLVCKSVDPAYSSLMSLSFPEDYDESQQRCKQIAHQLAQRHKHENILLV